MNAEDDVLRLKTQSVTALAQDVGARVGQARRARQESQREFAARARIPLRTYQRLERQGEASLETFLKVLVSLERGHYVPMLLPATPAVAAPRLVERAKALAAQARRAAQHTTTLS
jgi:transcriptional regulator with XRE-family HTH domain